MTKHVSHPGLIQRLRRAEGHLRSIVKMLEDDRPCLDIVQQLQAVEKAIVSAKKSFVHDHIDHCLDKVGGDGRAARAPLGEFKAIARYL
jgi:hypothetical protein NreA